MSRHRIAIAALAFVAAGVLFTSQPATAAEVPLVQTGQNLPPLSTTQAYHAGSEFADQIRAYQTSGQWAKDRAYVVTKARTFLAKWLKTTCAETNCKPAIVFDIDDTLASWYDVGSSDNFGYNPQLDAQTKQQCLTPKIKSTATLFDDAKRRGVDIFLITGRQEADRDATVACLDQLGLTGYKELILRTPDQASITAKAFKSSARHAIEQRGWTIGLSIGDQVSDSSGGYTDGRFVLPNPMYFIP